jgi:hypothetical protein
VGDGYKSDGIADTVYVIESGYGVLRWGETALECTAGDVLFVPGGQAHRFERLDGTIRVWRISTAFSLVPEADAILAGPSGGVADASGGRILLVVDEPAVRVVTAEALRDHGFTILEAEDGPGASRGWRARPRWTCSSPTSACLA